MQVRSIKATDIVRAVKEMVIGVNYDLGHDVENALREAREREESPVGVSVLDQLLENVRIAREEKVPICQDTGFAVFFVELGNQVVIEGDDLNAAINEGVRQGYQEGYLRKSIVRDPFRRDNTGDNTPAVIHVESVPGDKLKITFAAKGGGSENMSMVKMLKPADGIEGVKEFVIQRVKESGPNPCPPIIVGVGVGGTLEKAAILAKKALLRPIGSHNPDDYIAAVERDLLERINNLGIGPQGLGGRVTALAVHVDVYPCHIASLPVAVNIDCHVSRHREVTL